MDFGNGILYQFANYKNYIINTNVFYKLFKLTKGTLTIQHRPGSHHGYVSIASYIDFFSFAFEKNISSRITDQFRNPQLLTNFTFKDWNMTYKEYINYTIPNQNEALING